MGDLVFEERDSGTRRMEWAGRQKGKDAKRMSGKTTASSTSPQVIGKEKRKEEAEQKEKGKKEVE